ncbi:MAG: hypothetical protein QXZ22_08710 [Sulfolobales archaeon]
MRDIFISLYYYTIVMSEELLKKLKEVIDMLEKKEEKKEEHSHNIVQGTGGYFCKDCGTRFVEDKGFDLALDILKKQHGHVDSFLDCPTCKPKLFEVLKSQGWDIDDRGREIIIRKRK